MPARVRASLLVALLLATVPAAAQTSITVSYERRHDPFTYRFENASRLDTTEAVPHFFEQQYRGDNHWMRAVARYRAGQVPLETLVALSPPVVTHGSDIDTFFQPSGDVVVSGTSGDVTLQSWRLRQRVFLPAGRRVGFHIGYGFTRDRARFHDHVRTVTHTDPPSIAFSLATTRETTWSDVHAVQFGIEPQTNVGPWRLTLRAAGGTGLAQLTVQLPDKYPGVDLRFPASLLIADSGLTLQRRIGALTASVGVDYVHTLSLHDHSRLRRQAVTISAGAGWER